MKKAILFCLFFSLCFPVWGAECSAQKDPMLSVLSSELMRNFKTLKKQKPPVYYMSYQLVVWNQVVVDAVAGALKTSDVSTDAFVDIAVRVGNMHTDNTHELKGVWMTYDQEALRTALDAQHRNALRNTLWLGTQSAVEQALKDYNNVLTNKQVSSASTDPSDDFVLPQKSLFCQTQKPVAYERKEVEERLKTLSALVKNYDFIDASSFSFVLDEKDRYFVDSVGNLIRTPSALARYVMAIQAQTPDGMVLERNVLYDGFTMEDFPSLQQMKEDFAQMADELKQLLQAPVAEPYTGPVILKNRASGVFFHEILGHRLEGHRQKSDSFGQTFTNRVGKEIVSPVLNVSDNPLLSHFNGVPLRGYYLFDDEGNPAQNVTLIEKGVLKNFLMGASPIKGFAQSNGHGRKSLGKRAVARMGNTIITPVESVSYDELEKQLLEQVKKQGKPYGLIIEDISGGFTMTETSAPQAFKVNPLLVYKIYPDGHKEVVRGVDLVGTPLTSFSKITAAADDFAVFNGVCGAESGWVPVSAVSPSVLVSEMEVEKVEKSPTKPPILRPPYEGKHAKGGKK